MRLWVWACILLILYAQRACASSAEPAKVAYEETQAAVDSAYSLPDSLLLRTIQERMRRFDVFDMAVEGDAEASRWAYTLGDLLAFDVRVRTVALGPIGSFETLDIGGKSGGAVQATVEGVAYPAKDYRGLSLHDVPLIIPSAIRLDRGRGRIRVRADECCDPRPATQIRIQKGSRGLNRTHITFSERLGSSTDLGLGALLEGGTDKGRNSDFDRDAYAAHARRWVHHGRGRLTASLLRVQSDAGIPLSTAWPIGLTWSAKRRILRHRGMLKYERRIREASVLGISGWADGFAQGLRYPAHRDRNDVLLGTSIDGSLFLSDRQLLTIAGETENAWYKADDVSYEAATVGVLIRDTFLLTPQLLMQVSSQFKHHSKHRGIWQGRFRLHHTPQPFWTWVFDLHREARYPTFDEQFQQGYERSDTTMVVRLAPEHGIGLRAGCAVTRHTLRISSSFYIQQVDNWIGPSVTDPSLSYRNRAETYRYGLEHFLTWHPLNGGALRVFYEWSKARLNSREPVWHWPEHRFGLSLKYRRSYYGDQLAFSGCGKVAHYSRSYGVRVNEGRVALSATTMADAELRVRLLDFSAFYGVRNILDDTAAAWYGYPSEGRSFQWGIHWNLWN